MDVVDSLFDCCSLVFVYYNACIVVTIAIAVAVAIVTVTMAIVATSIIILFRLYAS